MQQLTEDCLLFEGTSTSCSGLPSLSHRLSSAPEFTRTKYRLLHLLVPARSNPFPFSSHLSLLLRSRRQKFPGVQQTPRYLHSRGTSGARRLPATGRRTFLAFCGSETSAFPRTPPPPPPKGWTSRSSLMETNDTISMIILQPVARPPSSVQARCSSTAGTVAHAPISSVQPRLAPDPMADTLSRRGVARKCGWHVTGVATQAYLITPAWDGFLSFFISFHMAMPSPLLCKSPRLVCIFAAYHFKIHTIQHLSQNLSLSDNPTCDPTPLLISRRSIVASLAVPCFWFHCVSPPASWS